MLVQQSHKSKYNGQRDKEARTRPRKFKAPTTIIRVCIGFCRAGIEFLDC
ncbi:hypothetical protein MtrunA17_Chr5g0414781 [Medicago truncatula]|uniref:Uncharacterized protein n=1 Tax=Medicago truncatula TaxID=3880 RepID=A0A396HRJ0_MEDTR|nr:hypothetical protein MtrunA17_Chr5g0414781 [Medicago truncatula]